MFSDKPGNPDRWSCRSQDQDSRRGCWMIDPRWSKQITVFWGCNFGRRYDDLLNFFRVLASRGVRVIHVPWSPQSASGPGGYDKLTIIDSLKWEKVLQIDQNAVHSWDGMVWSGMVFKISRWVFYGVLVSATVAFHSCRHWGAGSVWDVQLNAANRTIAPRQNPRAMGAGEQLVVGSYWQIQSCNFSILLKCLDMLGYIETVPIL